MIPNFSFVLEGRLAGCGHPARFQPLAAALAELRDRHRIAALVSLTEEPLPAAEVAAQGLEWFHLPVPDFEVPSLQQAGLGVRFVLDHLARERSVAVHCTAGLGRTGTLLACCLTALGQEPSEAVATVRRSRPGSIETARQEQFVRDWACWMRGAEAFRGAGPPPPAAPVR